MPASEITVVLLSDRYCLRLLTDVRAYETRFTIRTLSHTYIPYDHAYAVANAYAVATRTYNRRRFHLSSSIDPISSSESTT